MDLFTLQQKLSILNLEIFTLNDVVKITSQQKTVVKTFLSRLVKQNKLKRIKKGYYSFHSIDNKFQLQTVFDETYIGLYSALEYYGSTTQRYTNLDLITKNVLHQQTVENMVVDFHKVKQDVFFGYKKIFVNSTEVFISTVEKTILDCLYFSSKVYLTDVLDLIRQYKHTLDLELLQRYLHRINSSVLNKRVGFILELEGLSLSGLCIHETYDKLNIHKTSHGMKNEKWKLLINEDLENGENRA